MWSIWRRADSSKVNHEKHEGHERKVVLAHSIFVYLVFFVVKTDGFSSYI